MIPLQLENQLFCRVRKGEKRPFEDDWTNKGYTYSEIQKFIPSENYGVIAGINNLALLDDDTPNKILHALWDKNFPETMQVRGHYYFYLKNWDCQKIVLEDSKNTYPIKKLSSNIICRHCDFSHPDKTHHIGELQGKGSQGVGAGSLHPSGEKYILIKDLPIIEIDFIDFEKVFGKHFIKKAKVVREFKKTSWTGDNITDIPISNVISFVGLNDVGNGCYQGSHSVHGSTTGMNFRVNTNQNSWYCFRCQRGGGVSELIGVVEGIIDCSQSGSKCYSLDQSREVIKIAREKYGLRVPETQQDLEPQGWALSINIKTMAERRGFSDCLKCKTHLSFNEKMGWFECKNCNIRGGIKKLIEIHMGDKFK